MGKIRVKFDKLKEEVDFDLGALAGDLVGILEINSGSHPEWKESLDDLLIVTRQCVKMSPDDFWMKCEAVVQGLHDKRQELPVGILKQAHTHLLFILTRCSRLVQFQKESGCEQDDVLSLYPLNDMETHPEQILQAALQKSSVPPYEHEMSEQSKMPHSIKQGLSIINQGEAVQHVNGAVEQMEVSTPESDDLSSSSSKLSSRKRLPSTAEKKCQGHNPVYLPSKGDVDQSLAEDDNAENPDIMSFDAQHSKPCTKVGKLSSGSWGDRQNLTNDDSLICRICEFDIPIALVEEHSRICTISDRCDLKGLTVNERLERVAETIEMILDTWSPKGTDSSGGSFEVARLSTSNMHKEFNQLSLERSSLSRRCFEDMLDSAAEVENDFIMDDLNVSPERCQSRSFFKADQCNEVSLAGSSTPRSLLTPRSPFLTPRNTQIEILLSGKRTTSELENYNQVCNYLFLVLDSLFVIDFP